MCTWKPGLSGWDRVNCTMQTFFPNQHLCISVWSGHTDVLRVMFHSLLGSIRFYLSFWNKVPGLRGIPFRVHCLLGWRAPAGTSDPAECNPDGRGGAEPAGPPDQLCRAPTARAPVGCVSGGSGSPEAHRCAGAPGTPSPQLRYAVTVTCAPASSQSQGSCTLWVNHSEARDLSGVDSSRFAPPIGRRSQGRGVGKKSKSVLPEEVSGTCNLERGAHRQLFFPRPRAIRVGVGQVLHWF